MKQLLRTPSAPLAACLAIVCCTCGAGEPAPVPVAALAAHTEASAGRASSAASAQEPASVREFDRVPHEHSPAATAAALDIESLMLTPEPSWRTERDPTPAFELPNPFAQLRFRDQQPLVNRLRRLQALPFLTLWDSRKATLYLGVNRDGETGLHLRQKRDDRGARARNPLVDSELDLQPADVSRKAGPRAPRSIGR